MSSRRGHAGARLSAAVFLLGTFSSVVAAGIAFYFERNADAEISALSAELEARSEAGALAMRAMDEATRAQLESLKTAQWLKNKAAGNRAVALAVSDQVKASPGEHLGVADPTENRIVRFSALGVTEGATLSAARPVLARLHKKALRSQIAVDRDERGVWAIGPGSSETQSARKLVFVPVTGPDQETKKALDAARRALGSVAVPSTAERRASTLPFLLLGALLGGVLSLLWVHLRLSRPLDDALEIARDFAHGADLGAEASRADEARGGREAREIARSVNALIERAERLSVQGRAATEEDIKRAARAIEHLGQGDLKTPGPHLGEALKPLGQAIEQSRRALVDRVAALHETALSTASDAAEIAPAARRIKDAAKEQRDTLSSLGNRADDAVHQLKRAEKGLVDATVILRSSVKEQRRKIQEVRTSLSGLSRRVMTLRGGGTRLDDHLTSLESYEQALAFLARLAERSGDKNTKSKAMTLVGEGRTSYASLRRELAGFRDEVTQVAHALELLAQSQPEPVPDLDGGITGVFKDATGLLCRTGELAISGFRAMERAARDAADASEKLHKSALVAGRSGPSLSAALTEIRLGSSFEEDLLGRLARLQEEVKQAGEAEDGMTSEGRVMVKEVLESSAAVRAKLTRLVAATENAIDLLRG